MKKAFSIFFSLILLLFLSACQQESGTVINKDQKEVEFKCYDPFSRIYVDSLSNSSSLKTYHLDGYNDVPYISVRDFYELFVETECSYDNGIEKIKNKETESIMEINSNDDTIKISDYWAFFIISESNLLISDSSGSNLKCVSEDTNKDIHETIFNLGNYNFDIVAFNGKCYIPFFPLNLILSQKINFDFVYNGNDYYNTPYSNMEGVKDLFGGYSYSDYYKKFLQGKYGYSEAITAEYALYNYNGICFLYDNFFGLKDDLNIESFDTYFTDNEYKEYFLSSSPYVISDTLNKFIEQGLDIMHDSYKNSTFMSYRSKSTYVGTNYSTSTRLATTLERNRYRKLKDKTTTINGDDSSATIAIISFDEFEKGNNYYDRRNNSDNMSSTYYLLNYYLDILSDKNTYPKLKNIVFDVSINGGGDVTALIETLCLISPNGKTYLPYLVKTSGYVDACYQLDSNLDNNYDSNDGHYQSFDFYILTSEYTYSAASSFAFLAQKYNLAKVIGKKSGGGSCCVGSTYTAIGDYIAYSSEYNFGFYDNNNNFIDIDGGATPDINVDYDYFYDLTALNILIEASKINL